jgi:crotonobetainyl-CoA:carnitine CoA-transferase CaiB-like acyl-CoA transferase
VIEQQPRAAEVAPGARRQALAGLNVVELGGFAAGPVVGKHLANHGAEVIRIESSTRLDGFRTNYPPFKDNQPGVDRAGIFNYYNDGKRSVTLNLKDERGIDLARRLIRRADVVVENFTPGTLERLGLGYRQFAAEQPELVMLSTCNQGQFGPHAGHAGFGTHLTSLSGFTHLLGYPDGSPSLLYGPYIDFIAVGYGTVAVLAALRRRRVTGRGCYIDLSQYEAGLQFLAPALLDFGVNGRSPERRGNRHPSAAPHGVFPCAGEERWVALSAHDDRQWQGLRGALGNPSWGEDRRFATAAGRKRHEAELEALLVAETSGVERDELVARLQEQGVPAYAVNSMADLFGDPQLGHRGSWCATEHPVLGLAHVLAPPFRMTETPAEVCRPGPCLGADTDQVLREVLRLPEAEIAALREAGVLR